MTGPMIDPKLLPPKAHYFLYFGGVAAFWPYLTVFGKQLGLLESQVGYIFTVAPIAGIISMPLFGSIADRYKIKKKLFLLFNIINLFAILCFVFLTETETKIVRPVSLECGTGTTFIKHVHKGGINSKWDSSKVKESILEELSSREYPIVCQIDCVIEEIEGIEFCQALFNRDHEPLHFCFQNLTENDKSSASFKATLDFKGMTALENQIFMKVTDVGEIEDDERLNHRPISCHPPAKLKQCRITCPDLPAANKGMEALEGAKSGSKSVFIFWMYAFLTIVAWIAMAVVTSVADALCFQTLGNRSDLYGLQRKWGSIGWGMFTLLSGFLVDVVSGESVIKNYMPCYWIAAILLALNFVVCWKWQVEEEERPKALGRRMVALLCEPKITVFVLICVVVGICTGLQWNFLFWYIEDLAKERSVSAVDAGKWIKLLQGLISIVQCFCGELPFFYLAGKFLNKFGHVNSMAIVIGTFGIRFILYSLLINPWYVLPIELLQGLTYGIFYTNMATYAYVVSPEGTAATVQGIVGSAFEGVGVSLGSLIGGLMFEHLRGRSTFRIFGCFALLMCVLYKGVMMTIERRFEPVSQQPGRNDLSFGTEMKQIEKEPA